MWTEQDVQMNLGTETHTPFMLQLLKKKVPRQEVHWSIWRKKRERRNYIIHLISNYYKKIFKIPVLG